jgi:glucose-6-phosphate 1-dehydrogenase
MKLFIFGSTGDLVKRKVLHSLHNFKNIEVYAVGRRKLNNEEYTNNYCIKCKEYFKSKLNYIIMDYNKDIGKDFYDKLDYKKINYFYIALSPEMILNVLKKINKIKMKKIKIKVLIEKPFGHNLYEAKKLEGYIKKEKMERDIFLADHYLFKKGISKIKKGFNKIKIVALEEIGLEKRQYYDSTGALKDMVQNHFMNILLKFISPKEFKRFKIEKFRTGQYKGYEKEVGKKSNTETFVELKIILKNGKEIELITGKKMPKKESFIIINDKKIEINSNKEDYAKMFKDFFNNKSYLFPSISDAIFSWKVIKDIEKKRQELFLY